MIIWRAPIDEVDKARFIWSKLDGWQPVAGWTGHDMDDGGPIYTLQLLEPVAGGLRKAKLWKWQSRDPEKKYRVEPMLIEDESLFADAVSQVGFAKSRIEKDPAFTCYWIYEEAE